MSRVPALDGVRGIAALTVVVSHSANAGLLPGIVGRGSGQMAVGLFFILSGFLMTWLYAHRPVGDIPRFAVHRFARIGPLFLAIVLFSILFPQLGYPLSGHREMIELLTFVYGSNRFALWTIPVEVQFYVLFTLIWIAPRRMLPLLILLQLPLAALLFFLHVPMNTLPFWLHYFLFGVLCGYVWHRNSERLAGIGGSRAGWAILALAIFALPGVRHAIGVPAFTPLIDPVIMLGLGSLFVGSLLGLGPLRFFAARIPRWLGQISYGVYLIHGPVIRALKPLPLPGPAIFCLAVLVTLAIASLSFYFFETPVRLWLTAGRRRAPAAGIA